jgi:peptidylprolyl isomerase
VALIATLDGDGGGEAASQLPSQTPAAGTASPSSPSLAPATPPPISGTEVVAESGLKYIDIAEGTGASPQLGQTVVVNYTGWLESDGTQFDTSLDDGQPAQFELGKVIQGWNEGLSTMKVGGQRRLIIPADLAYGDRGTPDGSIPPNANLIFDVELLEIR